MMHNFWEHCAKYRVDSSFFPWDVVATAASLFFLYFHLVPSSKFCCSCLGHVFPIFASKLQYSAYFPPFLTLVLAAKSAFSFPTSPVWLGIHRQIQSFPYCRVLWRCGRFALERNGFLYVKKGAG